MEDLLGLGTCRAIGVSNYMVRHLEEVLEHGRVVPTVNQVEIHPFLRPRELVNFCAANDIQIESYSPLPKPCTSLTRSSSGWRKGTGARLLR